MQGLLGEMEHQGPLPRKASQVDPHKVMEHPACRGVLHPLAFVVWQRGLLLFECPTDAILSSRRDEPTDGHHHQQGHDAFGLFARARGGEKLGGFAEAKPALRMGLAFRAGSQCLGGQQGLGAFSGGEEATTLLVNEGRSGSDGGGERPGDRRDDLGRWGALTWSSTRAIGGCRTHHDLVQERGVSSLRKSRQCWLRIRFTGTRHAAELLESHHGSLALLQQLLGDCALRLGVAVLRGDEHPALGDPARGRGQAVRARARCQRGHRLGIGLGERGLRRAQRRRDTGHPLDVGLGELLEVVGGLEGTIRHQRGRPIRGLSLGNRVLDHLAALVRITALATQRFHQERHASLGLDDQLQHDLMQIGPMIPAGALGDVHHLGVRGRIAVRATLNMQARTVEMGQAGRKAQTLGGRRRSETGEFRYPGGREGIQGTSEGSIVELCGGNAGRNASGGGRMLEEPRDEGERVMEKPQAIAHHRFDGFTPGEVPHFRVLLGRAIEDVAKAEFVAHASAKAEVVQDLATVWRLVGHNHLL